MENTKKFIGLKDVILVTLLTAICIVIVTIVVLPFMANIKLVLWVVSGIEMLPCGPVYMLMVAKAPRYGTQLLFSFLFAIYYFITNGMLSISLMIFLIGVVRELLMLQGGYRSIPRLTASYALFGVGVMLSPVLLIVASKDSMIQTMVDAGMNQEYIDTVFAVYSGQNIAIGIVITILGAVLGSLLGYRMIRKHFAPAGVVGEA
ncbi:MAG: MptD family putative ECF transporter S component [Lachnospiraceae bacterium]